MLKDDPLYHQRRKAIWHAGRRGPNIRRMREWRRELHRAAVTILGGRCACCGEARITMLEIDHVHGGGSQERRLDKGNNFRLYQRIRDGRADLSKYQALCSNCNHSKRRNANLCEHFTERWAPWFFSGDAPIPSPYPFAGPNTASDTSPRHMEFP